MKSFSNIQVIPDDTSKYDVNYIRNVSYKKIKNSYFDFIKQTNYEYDDKLLSGGYMPYSIEHTQIEANHGDKVYIVMQYNKKSFMNQISILGAFKDPIEAIKWALRKWDEEESEENIINVIGIVIDPKKSSSYTK